MRNYSKGKSDEAELIQHSAELLSAAEITRDWALNIKKIEGN
jgi:hypothetical protein